MFAERILHACACLSMGELIKRFFGTVDPYLQTSSLNVWKGYKIGVVKINSFIFSSVCVQTLLGPHGRLN